jgi:hypothetical protein
MKSALNFVVKSLKRLLVLAILVLIAWVVMNNYDLIFAKNIKGEIASVERVEIPVALMASHNDSGITSKVFSFSIGIKDAKTGEIFTADSEDRQWAVAQKGQCVEAKFLPYPPWNLNKSGTYHGARLLKLYECPK